MLRTSSPSFRARWWHHRPNPIIRRYNNDHRTTILTTINEVVEVPEVSDHDDAADHSCNDNDPTQTLMEGKTSLLLGSQQQQQQHEENDNRMNDAVVTKSPNKWSSTTSAPSLLPTHSIRRRRQFDANQLRFELQAMIATIDEIKDHREPTRMRQSMKEIATLLLDIHDDVGAVQRIIPLIYDDIYIQTIDIIQSYCQMILDDWIPHLHNSITLPKTKAMKSFGISCTHTAWDDVVDGGDADHIMVDDDDHSNVLVIYNDKKKVKTFHPFWFSPQNASPCPKDLLPIISTIIYVSLFHEWNDIDVYYSEVLNIIMKTQNIDDTSSRNNAGSSNKRRKKGKKKKDNNQALLPSLIHITRQFHYGYGTSFIRNILRQQQDHHAEDDGRGSPSLIDGIVLQNLHLLIACRKVQQNNYSFRSISNDLMIIIPQYMKDICEIYGRNGEDGTKCTSDIHDTIQKTMYRIMVARQRCMNISNDHAFITIDDPWSFRPISTFISNEEEESKDEDEYCFCS